MLATQVGWRRPAMDFLVSGRQGMSVRWLIKTPAAPGEWVDRHSGSPAREFHRRMRMPQALSYHPWMVREESGKSLEFNCSNGNIDWLRLAQIAASWLATLFQLRWWRSNTTME